MKRFVLLSLLLLVVAVLSGCRSGTNAAPAAAVPLAPAREEVEVEALPAQVDVVAPAAGTEVTSVAPETPAAAGLEETLVDEQGAVAVAVTPLNVGQAGTTLDFEVAMNTHSVDLSMDLATLATLTADTGAALAASSWQAPLGGHHVSGVLSFPASSPEASLLDGATALTLTLVDVDAPARTFTWSLK